MCVCVFYTYDIYILYICYIHIIYYIYIFYILYILYISNVVYNMYVYIYVYLFLSLCRFGRLSPFLAKNLSLPVKKRKIPRFSQAPVAR